MADLHIIICDEEPGPFGETRQCRDCGKTVYPTDRGLELEKIVNGKIKSDPTYSNDGVVFSCAMCAVWSADTLGDGVDLATGESTGNRYKELQTQMIEALAEEAENYFYGKKS